MKSKDQLDIDWPLPEPPLGNKHWWIINSKQLTWSNEWTKSALITRPSLSLSNFKNKSILIWNIKYHKKEIVMITNRRNKLFSQKNRFYFPFFFKLVLSSRSLSLQYNTMNPFSHLYLFQSQPQHNMKTQSDFCSESEFLIDSNPARLPAVRSDLEVYCFLFVFLESSSSSNFFESVCCGVGNAVV